MFKTALLLGLAATAFAIDSELLRTLIPTPTYAINQDYYRNQRYQNQFDPYNSNTGNNFYQPNNYRHNQRGYFDKDYQKYDSGTYYNKDYSNNYNKGYSNNYNKDYYNKNQYNNDYYQKYNQDAKSAGILRFVNDVQPDGSYQYGFETQNGIAVEQQGVVRVAADQTTPVVVQGFYRYTSPEGVPVEVRYTADEFGYHPEGNVIPGQEKAVAYKTAGFPTAGKK